MKIYLAPKAIVMNTSSGELGRDPETPVERGFALRETEMVGAMLVAENLVHRLEGGVGVRRARRPAAGCAAVGEGSEDREEEWTKGSMPQS